MPHKIKYQVGKIGYESDADAEYEFMSFAETAALNLAAKSSIPVGIWVYKRKQCNLNRIAYQDGIFILRSIVRP